MFQKALPVWPENLENQMNCHAVFYADTTLTETAQLYITAASFYRVWVNDRFVAFGPARTAGGYARVDVLPLSAGPCQLKIEVAGYACCSLSTVKSPSFLQAEVRVGEKTLLYTGRDFTGAVDTRFVQAVQRYSIQRHFTEICDFRRAVQPCTLKPLRQIPTPIDRVVPYPLYEDVTLDTAILSGNLSYDATIRYQNEYSWRVVPESWGRFAREELPNNYTWLQRHHQLIKARDVSLPLTLSADEFAIFDFKTVQTGFINLDWQAVQECDLVIGFTEYYEGENFVLKDFHAHNVLEYFSATGERHQTLSFEPSTCRFVMVAVKSGAVQINQIGVKSYVGDPAAYRYDLPEDEQLAAICRAAVRTFSHNAVDVYMDCPSRERAGWLCDSYFTAKTEYALTGKTLVEDAFLENFRLYEYNGDLPEGVLPMCYPADIIPNQKNHFIPQWTMWYVLEVMEYVLKRGHEDKAEAFRPSIYGLVNFFAGYENEDGLLERLPSWNFVEWSDANKWTWDVNYPTNFLYAQMLECVGTLYGDEQCLQKCRRIRQTAIKQSYNGTYFQDHAVRDENGILQLQPQVSQAGQYYALLFGDIDMHSEQFAPLLDLILHKFDPARPGMVPGIMDVNAFIGAYLRLEALLKLEAYDLALEDVKKFFGHMEAATGTLWENRTIKGSNNHGFASYALVVIRTALQNKA